MDLVPQPGAQADLMAADYSKLEERVVAHQLPRWATGKTRMMQVTDFTKLTGDGFRFAWYDELVVDSLSAMTELLRRELDKVTFTSYNREELPQFGGPYCPLELLHRDTGRRQRAVMRRASSGQPRPCPHKARPPHCGHQDYG